MCKFSNDYIKSPKKVGEKFEAGIYAFNDDGSVITDYIEVKGFDPGRQVWKDFTKTIPDPKTGWAGMPMITLTDSHVGAWTMHFATSDKYGGFCGIGPYTLVVNPVSIPITLEADRISITSGNWVNFFGKYKPGVRIGIYSNKGHILTTVTNAAGDFMAGSALTITETSVQLLDIYACAEGIVSGVCPLLADKSNHIYIHVHPKEVPPPVVVTHSLVLNLSPLSWANLSGLKAYLPTVTTEFAKAITLYGWTGWDVIESKIEDSNKLVIYLRETASVGSVEMGSATNGDIMSLALPTVPVVIAALSTIAAIALRFGFLIIGWSLIDLGTKVVKVQQTQAETEQIRTKTVSDLCKTGELTPEQCSEALKPPPEKGLCETFGFSPLACEQLKTGVLVVGGLIGAYLLYSIVSKVKPSKAG